jgi:hypothetical protein
VSRVLLEIRCGLDRAGRPCRRLLATVARDSGRLIVTPAGRVLGPLPDDWDEPLPWLPATEAVPVLDPRTAPAGSLQQPWPRPIVGLLCDRREHADARPAMWVADLTVPLDRAEAQRRPVAVLIVGDRLTPG